MNKKIRIIHEFTLKDGYEKLLGLKMYDLNGRLVREFIINEKEEVTKEIIHRFDKDSRLFETVILAGKDEIKKVSALYNENGHLIEKKFDSNGNETIVKYVQEYEKEGVIPSRLYAEHLGVNLEIVRYSDFGKPIERIVQSTCYNSECNNYNEFDDELFFVVDYKVKFKYDSNGELISETTVDKYGSIISIVNYNLDGSYMKIETIQIAEEDWESTTREYNANNELISVLIETMDTKVRTIYEYSYDEYGNWLEMREVVDNKVNLLKKRIITYFFVYFDEK